MKYKFFLVVPLFFVLALGWVACDKDHDHSLRLLWTNSDYENMGDVEDNHIQLSVFASECLLMVDGGSGIYSVSCNNDSLLQVNLDQNVLHLKPLQIGHPVVKVEDGDGEVYLLNVEIYYPTQQFQVIKLVAQVGGENVTVGDKEEIEEKVMNSFPLQIGGGYKLTYLNAEMTEGKVEMFAELLNGEVSKEGTFEQKRIQADDWASLVFTMKFGEEEVEYEFGPYSGSISKSVGIVPMAFVEELTSYYRTDYPEVESVLAWQVVKSVVP